MVGKVQMSLDWSQYNVYMFRTHVTDEASNNLHFILVNPFISVLEIHKTIDTIIERSSFPSKNNA